jgi:hypothetical protein
MHVIGNKLYDTAGARFIPIGIEEPFGFVQNDLGNISDLHWTYATDFVNVISDAGANCFRCLIGSNFSASNTVSTTVTRLGDILERADSLGLVVFITFYNGASDEMLGNSTMKTLLNTYKHMTILDCVLEPAGENDASTLSFCLSNLSRFRSYGYTQPLMFQGNQAGRNLRWVLDNAATVLAADPLKNCLFSTQMYWADNYNGGFRYEDEQGFSSAQAAFQQVLNQTNFFWMAGLIGRDVDGGDDSNGDPANIPFENFLDYLKAGNGGYLWWQGFEDGSNLNDMFTVADDATATSTDGDVVAYTHEYSLTNAAVKRTDWTP